MVGEAIAFGAVSIVSALATGRGASMGIGLSTKAHVELLSGAREIRGVIQPNGHEDTRLIVKCMKRVLRYFKKTNLGAVVRVQSNIPIARGLKSSSAASNAVVLATAAALGRLLRAQTAVSLGVDAAWAAGVTKTGAFDDACASMFGGIVVTDNRKRKLIRRYVVAESDRMCVLLHVPARKRYTGSIHVKKSGFAKEMSQIALNEVKAGNWSAAMTLNGIVQSASYSLNMLPAIEAIRAGAIAAGLSGKGPATGAVVPLAKRGAVMDVLRHHSGQVIETRINNEHARILS